MEEEMNYLSEKIVKFEGSIDELEKLATLTSGYDYSLKQLRIEKMLLENILNKLTELELS